MGLRYFCNILLTLFLFSRPCVAQVDSHSDSVYYEGFKRNRGVDISSAAKFALQAHSSSVVYGHTLFTIKSCNALGYCYEKMAQLDSAKYYYAQGIRLSIKESLLDRATFMLNNMGNIFESEAKYDSALYYYTQSLSFAEQTKSWQDQAIAINNIGIVYYRLRSMEEALSNFIAAYTIRTERKINDGLASNLVNIAHCYAYLGKSKKAEEFFKLMLTFCEDNDCDPDTKLDGLHALGKALGKLGKHKEAYENLSLGYSQANKSSNVFLTTSLLISYAYEELLAGKTDSALVHLNKGYQLSLTKKMPILTLEAFENYSKLYQQQGDFAKAFDYLTKYSSLKDSIFSEQLNESLKRLAISKQTKIIATQKNEIDVRQNFIIILTLAISIVIGSTVYFYRKFRFTDKTRSYLRKEVDVQTVALRHTNKKLLQAMSDYDHFLYKASHDLRGPISTLLGLFELINLSGTQAIKDITKMGVDTTLKLDAKLAKLTFIHELNIAQPVIETGNVSSVVDDVSNKLKHLFSPLVDFKVAGEATASFDRKLLTIALENIIKNSINYIDTKRPGQFIHVTVSGYEKHSEIRVEDSGSGIDKEHVRSLFKLFSVGHQSSDKPTGVGLYASRLALERFGASVDLIKNSNPTTFRIQLPNEVKVNDIFLVNAR